jgi:hypothetical protein
MSSLSIETDYKSQLKDDNFIYINAIMHFSILTFFVGSGTAMVLGSAESKDKFCIKSAASITVKVNETKFSFH